MAAMNWTPVVWAFKEEGRKEARVAITASKVKVRAS
jgi:hypothetical protein